MQLAEPPRQHPLDDDSVSVAAPLQRYRALLAAGQIKPDPNQAAVAARLDRLHQDLAGWRPPARDNGWRPFWRKERPTAVPPKGLYVHGGVGRGKSMLMDLFFASAPVARKRRVHFHAFMAEVHQRLHDLRTAKANGAADPLPTVAADIARDSWLLCFDEFVVNNIADAMILGRLFQSLFAEGVVVVATSNFAPHDLYQDGLQRDRFEPFIHLIAATLEVIALDGPTDYRLERLKGRPVYHAPLGPAADRAIEETWADLIGSDTPAPAEVMVLGRKVRIPAAARQIARFQFDDLCAKPLGASDYLAIAGLYHTVIVERIPLLSPANHNEARRFITLIDALYETRTTLVCSAAAAPDALYPEGTGAFEFGRTASRLMEMQSADWLAGPSRKS